MEQIVYSAKEDNVRETNLHRSAVYGKGNSTTPIDSKKCSNTLLDRFRNNCNCVLFLNSTNVQQGCDLFNETRQFTEC